MQRALYDALLTREECRILPLLPALREQPQTFFPHPPGYGGSFEKCGSYTCFGLAVQLWTEGRLDTGIVENMLMAGADPDEKCWESFGHTDCPLSVIVDGDQQLDKFLFLLKAGASVENTILLDNDEWLLSDHIDAAGCGTTFAKANMMHKQWLQMRANCASAIRTMLGVHKWRNSKLCVLTRDAMRLVVLAVWETRAIDEWFKSD